MKKNYQNEPSIHVLCEDIVTYLHTAHSESAAAYIANFSLIHIPDEEIGAVFFDISRTLITNGVFVMSCHKGNYKGMEQEPYQTQNDSRVKKDRKLESYMNYFEEDELKERIENAGLTILTIETFDKKLVSGEIPVPKIWILATKK